MLLSIITINRNNAVGLAETLKSVISQTITDYEHIIVDGASTDGSVELIRKYAQSLCIQVKWISEPDKGIYHAMNKGIEMASGEYLQFLNSGDRLASTAILENMYKELDKASYPSILYGNMLKDMPDGSILCDRSFAGKDITLLGFYKGTLNHSSAYIKRVLFEKYGLYDESLKIVSDWKWFFQAIILGAEKPTYADIDVILFDMTGISETNKDLTQQERYQVISELVPSTILKDYETWSHPIEQMKRLSRHPWAYKIVWLVERCLFKAEKARDKRRRVKQCQ